MINEGITSFKLYMTYPAMIVDDEDLYKIIKSLMKKAVSQAYIAKMQA